MEGIETGEEEGYLNEDEDDCWMEQKYPLKWVKMVMSPFPIRMEGKCSHRNSIAERDADDLIG